MRMLFGINVTRLVLALVENLLDSGAYGTGRMSSACTWSGGKSRRRVMVEIGLSTLPPCKVTDAEWAEVRWLWSANAFFADS